MPKEIKPEITGLNTGLVELGPDRGDFLGGTIPFEKRISSGNWEKYLPEKELQKRGNTDVLGCVSFSNLNAGVETQINWMIATGLLKKGEEAYDFLEKHGYLKNGKVECSDRYLAKLSGTTRQGNSIKRVADAMRHYGCVPEKMWPWPKDATWNEYYKEVPSNVIEIGQQFLRYFDYQYEWITDRVSDKKVHLQHAPLQIGSAICPGWKDGGVIKACNQRISHATMIYGYDDGEYWNDFDHYLDVLGDVKKKLAWNYKMPYILKGVVLKKNFMPSDLKAVSKLLKVGSDFKFFILPHRDGELYVADVTKGKNSWKHKINGYAFAQGLAKSKMAHGISNAMADKIRTVENLEDIKYLYK